MKYQNFIMQTNRLILRLLNVKDIEIVHIYASDKENTRYMMYLPNNTKEETEQFLSKVTHEWEKDEPQYYEFAVVLNGKQIGAVSVYLNDQRTEGELGWIINKLYWGNGYATESAMMIKDFAINKLKVHKLVAHCDHRNIASYTVMKKIGLKPEDNIKERQYPKTMETAQEFTYSLSTFV